jgi:O-succinylbenzoic acid--CoA ligase
MRLHELLNALTTPDRLPLTSGSSGTPRRCHHTPDTYLAAAEGFVSRFPDLRHAINVLPQEHISGIMPEIRCAVAGGRVHRADYRLPESWVDAPFDLAKASVSLVPTQLFRLMGDAAALHVLQRIATIFLGGAPVDAALLERARAAGLRLAPCYGMSETAAMVTALDPDAFLAGASGVGTPLPHASLQIMEGILHIDSPAVCHGYLPATDNFQRQPFRTSDIARCDSGNTWHILGRADRVIISGGKKVHPESIEALAVALPGVRAARCSGVSDPDWGQRVHLDVCPVNDAADPAQLATQLRASLAADLPAHALPKSISVVADAKLSALGKWRA